MITVVANVFKTGVYVEEDREGVEYPTFFPPSECRKAAASLVKRPVLMGCHAFTWAKMRHRIIGFVADARYDHPFIRAQLVLWPWTDPADIDGRHLSLGHTNKMFTSGNGEIRTVAHVPYTAIARDLIGLHVSLGRPGQKGACGADCSIQLNKEFINAA
jgi:hypothetical protein